MNAMSPWWKEFPWARDEEGSRVRNLLLYVIGRAIKAKIIVNIGIGQQPNGIYTLGLLALENQGLLTAIDISSTCIGRANQLIDQYQLPVTVLQHDSKSVVWLSKIDLLYIDGGHSEEQVRGDIANFARRVRRNGYMIFDDYGKKHLGVTQAVDAFMEANPDAWQFSQLPQLWWCVCRRK